MDPPGQDTRAELKRQELLKECEKGRECWNKPGESDATEGEVGEGFQKEDEINTGSLHKEVK